MIAMVVEWVVVVVEVEGWILVNKVTWFRTLN